MVREHSPSLVAIDVTQAIGRVPLDVSQADFIVSSTHKWLLAGHGGGIVGVPKASKETWKVPAGGWMNIVDAFGSNRFEKAEGLSGAAGFSVGMPNFPAVYALHAALRYLKSIGISNIDDYCRPLVTHCMKGLQQLPIDLITPDNPAELAGIIAFRHHESERIHRHLREKQIHVMHQAGRLRMAIHGYNTFEDVESVLKELSIAI
jgi:cysteine desulfurase / selenocysteine lyase